MLFKTTEESLREYEEFKNHFKEQTGETVLEIEFAEVRADKSVYRALGIQTESWQDSTWGLIVFAEGSIYYFTSTRENYLARLMRSVKNNTKESVINFSGLKELTFCFPKKTFFSFFNAESKRTLNSSFIDSNGKRQFFKLITSSSAFEIWKKLTSYK